MVLDLGCSPSVDLAGADASSAPGLLAPKDLAGADAPEVSELLALTFGEQAEGFLAVETPTLEETETQDILGSSVLK